MLLFCILAESSWGNVLNPILIFDFLLYFHIINCALLYSGLLEARAAQAPALVLAQQKRSMPKAMPLLHK